MWTFDPAWGLSRAIGQIPDRIVGRAGAARRGWLGFSFMLSAAGCAAAGRVPVHHEITRVLEQQAAAWNAGDVEAFMQAYARSPDLTFSFGGQLTRGWQETMDRYKRRYPDRQAMGQLTISDLEVIELGPQAALVLGRWNLARTEPVGGAFSLVMRKEGHRWLIIHDHTSREAS